MNPYSLTSKIIHFFIRRPSNMNDHDYRRLQFTALVYFQSLIVGLVFIPTNYSYGGFLLSLYGITFATNNLICLSLLRIPKLHNFSRILFITIANGMIIGMHQHVGHGSEVHFFYGPALSLPFLMYPKENRKTLIFSVALPFSLLILTYFYKAPFFKPIVIPTESINIYGFISAILAISMLAYGFYFLYKITLEHEENLTKQSESLIQSEKMSSLGILAAGLAHEINNPLTIINSSARSLRLRAEDLDSEKIITFADRIQSTSERISKIVSSLRVFSRNSLKDKNEKVHILHVLEHAHSLCQQRLSSFIFEVNCPVNVYADGSTTEILQTVFNLINNAIDECENTPKPWIKINVEVLMKNNNKRILIAIVDSGVGISQEILNNLFTPFFTTKEPGKGTGLGLALSKKLMESRGGTLNYKLINGHTGFVIDLPSAS